MTHSQYEHDLIRDTAANFPRTFGLRAWPGALFRISTLDSFVNYEGQVTLYTETERDGRWYSFAKCTPEELRREIVSVT
jgi:hypothetical protein